MNWYILVENEIPACPYLLISRYKNRNHIFHISIELLLMFLIWKFKLHILREIFSGASERRRKLEMLGIWNQRGTEK